MNRLFAAALGASLCLVLPAATSVDSARAQDQSDASERALLSKVDAYVTCLNDVSPDIYGSRARYFGSVGSKGPTDKENSNYGLYSVDDPTECLQAIAMASDVSPHHPDVGASATAYVNAVSRIVPLIKEAYTYYDQGNYNDDNMAKGKALHPRLVAAWAEFAAADYTLRQTAERVKDARGPGELAAIEAKEGRTMHYQIEALMLHAWAFVATIDEPRDIAKIIAAINQYEATLTAIGELNAKKSEQPLGPDFFSNARSFLAHAKIFMRRVRDKTPYSRGDRMIPAVVIEDSPADLARRYSELITDYNKHNRSPYLNYIPASFY